MRLPEQTTLTLRDIVILVIVASLCFMVYIAVSERGALALQNYICSTMTENNVSPHFHAIADAFVEDGFTCTK